MNNGLLTKPRCCITVSQQWNCEVTGSLPLELLNEVSSFCTANIRHRIFLTNQLVGKSLRKAAHSFCDADYRKFGIMDPKSQLDAIGSVRHLRVAPTSPETLDSIVKLIERSPYLESLSISFYSLSNLAGKLAKIGPKARLRHLSVRFSNNETEAKAFITSIAPPELRSLTLTGPRLDHHFLQLVSQQFRRLESIQLRISSYVSHALPKIAQTLEPFFSIPTMKDLSVRTLYAPEFVPVLIHQNRSLSEHPFVAFFADKPILSRLHPLFVRWITDDDVEVDFVASCIERNKLAAVAAILPLHFNINDPEYCHAWFMKMLNHASTCLTWLELLKSRGYDFASCHWFLPAVRVLLRWQVLLQNLKVPQIEQWVPEVALPEEEQPSIVVSLVELLNLVDTATRQHIVVCCLMDLASDRVPVSPLIDEAVQMLLSALNKDGCSLLEKRCLSETEETFLVSLVKGGKMSLLRAYLTCPINPKAAMDANGLSIRYGLNSIAARPQKPSVYECLSFCRSLGL
eukprot:TRINITY_DN5044_c0_g1_i1.p1 TRINITY_DN5044_c0_g1~~TRINITY_DN5044_c0_g1_i1.p1  ORF type:complete len:515 (-),score=61.35 TRINITY_DN5044_c0_g1_i1:33-1577(-)